MLGSIGNDRSHALSNLSLNVSHEAQTNLLAHLAPILLASGNMIPVNKDRNLLAASLNSIFSGIISLYATTGQTFGYIVNNPQFVRLDSVFCGVTL